MKRSELITYPPPAENPDCQCYPSAMNAFFCPYGHMTECHYPKPCDVAKCSHLARYDIEFEEEDESITDQPEHDEFIHQIRVLRANLKALITAAKQYDKAITAMEKEHGRPDMYFTQHSTLHKVREIARRL